MTFCPRWRESDLSSLREQSEGGARALQRRTSICRSGLRHAATRSFPGADADALAPVRRIAKESFFLPDPFWCRLGAHTGPPRRGIAERPEQCRWSPRCCLGRALRLSLQGFAGELCFVRALLSDQSSVAGALGAALAGRSGSHCRGSLVSCALYAHC
jgi:hypothetical protein